MNRRRAEFANLISGNNRGKKQVEMEIGVEICEIVPRICKFAQK